jgi:predicted permease
METFFQDLKHSLRMFRQNPAFTFAAVAALALGIGANTAIFSVVNAVLLSPLDLYEPDRIVQVRVTSPQGNDPRGSPAKFAHWKTQDDILEMVTASRNGIKNYTGGDEPEQVPTATVSADYFRLYGAQVVQGRTFTPEEDLPNGPLAAVISHSFWERRFDADPGVLGRSIVLGGMPYTVVGVMDPDFAIPELQPTTDVWIPFQLDPNSTDQGHYFGINARLKPGVTVEQARARLQSATEAFREKFPQFGEDQAFDVLPLREALVANSRSTLLVLMGAVGFVLLIACANVANLLLARATGRRREIGIRSAIGAGRGRIVRQLLTESVLLATIAGVVGLALGAAGIRALLAVNTAGLPRIGQDGSLVSIDWRVMGFTLAASIVTGVLFGLIPAMQGSRADLSGALKEGGGRSGTGFRQNKARSVLIVTEVALALVLLVGSTLLIRTSMALGNVDPGYNVTNVITMRMSLAEARFATSESVERLVEDGVRRLEALPGVEVSSATCCVPLQGGYGLPFVIAGRPLEGPYHGGGGWLTISPGYFDVFQIPVKRGRAFEIRDNAAGPPVVIINEAMARQFWPEGDPLEDRLIIGRGVMREFNDEPERQIVGIVGDVRDSGLNNDPGPRMYVPQAQISDAANVLNTGLSPLAWVVRTAGNSSALTEQMQAELRQASGLPVANVASMEEIVSNSLSRQKFNMWLMTVFGFVALLLAAIGIYGLMAYSVQQRTQEIGIRLALGARLDQVRNMVVAQGMKLAVVGVAIGIGAAYGLTQSIASFLFGVEAHDPLTFVAVPALLGLVALAAIWIPARRASRVEPLKALRYE